MHENGNRNCGATRLRNVLHGNFYCILKLLYLLIVVDAKVQMAVGVVEVFLL